MSDYISFAHARAMLMLAMAIGVRLSTVESRYRRDPAFKSQVDEVATQVAVAPPESKSIH
jgi:hypothetical protein